MNAVVLRINPIFETFYQNSTCAFLFPSHLEAVVEFCPVVMELRLDTRLLTLNPRSSSQVWRYLKK